MYKEYFEEHEKVPALEKFEEEENSDENKKTETGRTFVGIFVVLLAMLLTFGFVWSYLISTKVFVAVLSSIVLVFSGIMIFLITSLRRELSTTSYYVYFSSASFMAFVSAIIAIVFIFLSINVVKKDYSGRNRDFRQERPVKPDYPPFKQEFDSSS